MKKFYKVKIENINEYLSLNENQVIFHGINKSASKALTDVFFSAYINNNKKSSFLSHYDSSHGGNIANYIDVLNKQMNEHFFMASHNLFGAIGCINKNYITMFRNPIVRILSIYNWLKIKHNETRSLEEFVISSKLGYSQVIQIAYGYDNNFKINQLNLSPKEIYKKAIYNLENHISWYGIAEEFEKSAFILAHHLNIPEIPAWKQDTRNIGRPPLSDINEETLELIKNILEYDIKFYNHVVDKFNDKYKNILFKGDYTEYKDSCRSEYKDKDTAMGSQQWSNAAMGSDPI